jgi:hypothetical protein
MAGGPNDGDEREEGVVRPEDLDFTRDESVAEIRNGRYVISTDRSSPPDPDVDDEESNDDPDTDPVSVDAARERLVRHVSEFDAPHGFALTAAVDGELRHHEAFSEDLPDVFGELLTWYATVVSDGTTPPAEVLGILLVASDCPVRFPVRTVGTALEAHGLTPQDSIADLLRAIEDEGFEIPPED